MKKGLGPAPNNDTSLSVNIGNVRKIFSNRLLNKTEYTQKHIHTYIYIHTTHALSPKG
jgi:hypothetical protein